MCWVEHFGALGRLSRSAITFQEECGGLYLAEPCGWDPPLCKPGSPRIVKLFTAVARTRLKSLKWNSLKMASLPSTSFQPTALRLGSSCSLSSALSLWAFPAWCRRDGRQEEQVSVAGVGRSGCSKQRGVPWAVELWGRGGSCRPGAGVRVGLDLNGGC